MFVIIIMPKAPKPRRQVKVKSQRKATPSPPPPRPQSPRSVAQPYRRRSPPKRLEHTYDANDRQYMLRLQELQTIPKFDMKDMLDGLETNYAVLMPMTDEEYQGIVSNSKH
jgi:hypothetical protein